MVQNNLRIYLYLFCSFIAAIAIGFLNSYVVNLKGAEVDAERFLELAGNWVAFGEMKLVVDAEFFIQFLGIIMYLFDANEFFLTIFGILVYYSVFYIYYRDDCFYFGSKSVYVSELCLVLCLLSPSVLLRIGALLREPYLIFFLFFSVLCASKYLLTSNVKWLLLSFVCLSFGMFFHKAMLAFAPLFVAIFIVFNALNWKKALFGLIIVSLVSYGAIVFLFPSLIEARGGGALGVIVSGDTSVAERVVGYKANRDFRTTYDYGADFSSLFGIIGSVIRANVYYYLSPFPWNLSTAVDYFAFIENGVRIFILAILIASLTRNIDRYALFALVCYFAFNTIWALGTSNYGTGSRHHITTMPLMLLAICLSNLKRDGFFPKKEKRSYRGDFV